MDTKYDKAKEILKKYNQIHVIPFLENGENTALVEQILKVDFEELNFLYNMAKEKKTTNTQNISPIEATDLDKLSKIEVAELEEIGENILKQNKYAVCTMAGGQGTRLRTYRT